MGVGVLASAGGVKRKRPWAVAGATLDPVLVSGSVQRRDAGAAPPARQRSALDSGATSCSAKTFPGSAPRPRFVAATYRTAITEKLDAGPSLQRIWQDLVEEYGYGASYESVKRFVRTIAPRRAVGVFHCAPGADYGESPVMVSSLAHLS